MESHSSSSTFASDKQRQMFITISVTVLSQTGESMRGGINGHNMMLYHFIPTSDEILERQEK